MLVCFGRFISKVSILDVNAMTSSIIDVPLNIPNMESVPRADITTGAVEH